MAKTTGANIRQSGKRGGDAKGARAVAGGGRAGASAKAKFGGAGAGAGATGGKAGVSQRGGSATDQTAIGSIKVSG